MYPKDEHGEYRVLHEWIEAFDSRGAKGFASYFQACEARSYSDGVTRVVVSKPVYLQDKPAASFAHGVYVNAQNELRSFIKR